MRFALDFGAGVLHGDGQACGAHGGQIDDVIANKGGFLRFDSRFLDYLFKARPLVVDSLANIFELQVAGAQGDGFRDALGDESSLDSGETRE